MPKVHTLFLDSRKANFKTNNIQFSFLLNSYDSYPGITYDNVTSVELTAITFQNGLDTYSITSDVYFILDIEELNNRIHSNVAEANNAFAIIFKDNGASEPNVVQKVKGQDFDPKIRVFDPPLPNLNRLSFKILTGDQENFPVNDSYEGFFTFLFSIKTK
jgi:hypothetical protein